MRNIIIGVIVVVVVGVLIYFGAKSYKSTYSTKTNSSTSTNTSASSASTANQNAISIENFAFKPSETTVKVGTEVTWTNNDSVTHTITSDNGVFSSGDIAPGATFKYTFAKSGTYAYHCTIHPSMTGKVIVK